jgi:hypothetical protein
LFFPVSIIYTQNGISIYLHFGFISSKKAANHDNGDNRANLLVTLDIATGDISIISDNPAVGSVFSLFLVIPYPISLPRAGIGERIDTMNLTQKKSLSYTSPTKNEVLNIYP